MRHVELLGSLVEDERQLDGSRHVEIVGSAHNTDLALRLVIDRNGSLHEADLSLEIDGAFTVIEFDGDLEIGGGEQLSVHLRSPEGKADVSQREDGDVALTVTLFDSREPDE